MESFNIILKTDFFGLILSSRCTCEDIQKEEIKEAIQLCNFTKLKSDVAEKTKLEELSRTEVRQAQE